MMRIILASLLIVVVASAESPEPPQAGWAKIKKGEVTFSAPSKAIIKEVAHDEGTILSVFPRGLDKARLEIRVEAGGCVLPMSKMILDDQNRVVFELKYKVGDKYRNDSVVLSKRSQTVCSVKYKDATLDEAEELDSIIKSISISVP